MNVVSWGWRRATQALNWMTRRAQEASSQAEPSARRYIDVRIAAGLFESVRSHVEDPRRGEEAGFLLCSLSRLDAGDVLLVREWHPIPDMAIRRRANGSVLSWTADFNSDILQRALDLDASPVLVHSHGGPAPTFSSDDRAKERPLFAGFSGILGQVPTGSLLLGRGCATGSFWMQGQSDELAFRRLVVVGSTIELWPAVPRRSPSPARRRLDRQTIAIGPESDRKLAEAVVAVVGVSGGGSHVFQQLTHQGVGTLIPIDDQLLEETNLGRHVGARRADVDRLHKTAISRRLANDVDPLLGVREVTARFPSEAAITALKSADVIVTCLDRFDARAAVNSFCRRYLIPLVDVGMTIRTADEHLVRADGQVIVTLPGQPCLRCFFLTDATLEAERRERPPGYDDNPDAPGQPQVVSMNGVLASEACNCVLDLLTGYSGGSRGAGWWQYDGRTGQLTPSELPSARPGCPACSEEGLGDPPAMLG